MPHPIAYPTEAATALPSRAAVSPLSPHSAGCNEAPGSRAETSGEQRPAYRRNAKGTIVDLESQPLSRPHANCRRAERASTRDLSRRWARPFLPSVELFHGETSTRRSPATFPGINPVAEVQSTMVYAADVYRIAPLAAHPFV